MGFLLWRTLTVAVPITKTTYLVPKHVSTDIMTPLTVSDITGRSSEFGLERQTVPGNDRITREANRVTMTSGTGISRECESPIALAARIDEMVVVEHPERVDAGHFGIRALLPVEPPEIDAFIFERVVQFLEVFRKELLVGAFERDWLGE